MSDETRFGRTAVTSAWSVVVTAPILLILATSPAAAQCATISVTPTDLDPRGDFLTVEVVDTVEPPNPLTVRVVSRDEPDGEVLTLIPVSPGTYRGAIGISTKLNVPQSLFVNPRGATPAEVRAIYFDDDSDGSGTPCPNTPWGVPFDGQIEATATVDIPSAMVVIRSVRFTDNGDNDGIPDTNETSELFVTLINKGPTTLTNVVGYLYTDSAEIEGIIVNQADFPDLPPGVEVEGSSFVFRVGPFPIADRVGQGFDDDTIFEAKFRLTLTSNEIDAAEIPLEIVTSLDLDFTGGSGPIQFTEGFESGTFGSFTTSNLDAGRSTLAWADGFRCSQHDPDYPPSNSASDPLCYMGVDPPQADAFFWQIESSSALDGGRAATGSISAYFGVHGTATPGSNSTPTGTLEAIRMNNPVNLAWSSFDPVLSFKHQVSLMDNRVLPIPIDESIDAAVVQVQRAGPTGIAIGPWETIEAYYNGYDVQRSGTFTDCMFDPVDDGTTEDDFFSSIDRVRQFGPSSTCWGQRVFGYQGDTILYAPGAIGRATDGPGIAGSLGTGTWVESRFSLVRFRGHRIRLRFLASTTKHPSQYTWATTLPENSPADDGWYIDDIRITDVLNSPVTKSSDNQANDGLPSLGAICNKVSPILTANPATFPSGGGTTVLSAAGSTSNRCVDGILQYRFWIDVNQNLLFDPGVDVILRDFLDNTELSVLVLGSTQFALEARCSSLPSCSYVTFQPVTVGQTPGDARELTLSTSGGMLTATYTPACEASDHTLYWTSSLADVANGTYPEQHCSIGTSGSYTFPDPGTSVAYFVVVGHDAAGKEGSYGTSGGMERPQDTNDLNCARTQDLSDPCQ